MKKQLLFSVTSVGIVSYIRKADIAFININVKNRKADVFDACFLGNTR